MNRTSIDTFNTRRSVYKILHSYSTRVRQQRILFYILAGFLLLSSVGWVGDGGTILGREVGTIRRPSKLLRRSVMEPLRHPGRDVSGIRERLKLEHRLHGDVLEKRKLSVADYPGVVTEKTEILPLRAPRDHADRSAIADMLTPGLSEEGNCCGGQPEIAELLEAINEEKNPASKERLQLKLAGYYVGQKAWRLAEGIYVLLLDTSVDPAVISAAGRNLEVVHLTYSVEKEDAVSQKEVLQLELAMLHHDMGHEAAANRIWRRLARESTQPEVQARAAGFLKDPPVPTRLLLLDRPQSEALIPKSVLPSYGDKEGRGQ